MNKTERMQRLLDFIEDTRAETLPDRVTDQAKKCFLDLSAALCAGAKNKSAKLAAQYAFDHFAHGEATILATGNKTDLIGAALANGMAANALDMDDGSSLLRGHPGAGFFGALLSAAEVSHCTYGEFLSALIVSYETSIRHGFIIRHYYGWDHSSGSYSTFGTAAGAGKLLGLTRQQLEMALGIADFICPVDPAKRSCYVPSMNKDGIYWGQQAGMQAVLMAQSGITGRNPVVLDDGYEGYIETLGSRYYMFDLYIKFYSCCRWVHAPIRAVKELMSRNGIGTEDIAQVDIYSFGNAGTLYMEAPQNEDEAQYNIKYPIAAQLVFGDCGPLESSTDRMLDSRIPPVIEKIVFHHEPEYDKVFPGRRLCRAEITTNSGMRFVSEAVEPLGDRNADVSIDDITAKFVKINGLYAEQELCLDAVNAVLETEYSAPFSTVFEKLRILAGRNIHPEICFV